MASSQHADFTKLDSRDYKKLRVALKKDVEFLRSEGLMDYSLLLGIEKTKSSRDLDEMHQMGAARVSVRRPQSRTIRGTSADTEPMNSLV